MIMDESWYMDWYWNKATDDEKRLIDKVYEFGELFEDMLFEPGTNTYELIKIKSKRPGDDEWIDDELDRPEELAYFSYSFFRYKVAELEHGDASFNQDEQLITVKPEMLESDRTILHELIHLHEFVINEQPMYYHDALYWALYKDLKTKIPKLDEIITEHAHFITDYEIHRYGGVHDIMFLLKSFDLDIRMGYPLGRVFGYGLEEDLKEYSYLKQ